MARSGPQWMPLHSAAMHVLDGGGYCMLQPGELVFAFPNEHGKAGVVKRVPVTYPQGLTGRYVLRNHFREALDAALKQEGDRSDLVTGSILDDRSETDDRSDLEGQHATSENSTTS